MFSQPITPPMVNRIITRPVKGTAKGSVKAEEGRIPKGSGPRYKKKEN